MRFEPDDLGAEMRELHRTERPGPHPAEVGDAHALEGQRLRDTGPRDDRRSHVGR